MSVELAVTAKIGKGESASVPMTINVQAGETAEESIEMFGTEAVNSNANANWKVTLQSAVRAAIKAGLTPEAAQEKLGGSKMGVNQPRGSADPVAAMMNKWGAMDPEAKKAFMAQLKAAA